MISSRIGRFACLVLATFLLVAGTAHADVPVGPAHFVPCPGMTGNAQRYLGPSSPYRCHSAVVDPLGNVVVLRQGGFVGTPSAFGYLHTARCRYRVLQAPGEGGPGEQVPGLGQRLPAAVGRTDIRVIVVEPAQVADLAAMIRRDYSPAALDPGVSEPTLVEAADGSRALVLPRDQQPEPLRSLRLVDAAAVGSTLVVTFTWEAGTDDDTVYLMPLDARDLDLDLDDPTVATGSCSATSSTPSAVPATAGPRDRR
ncbi:hypothetical protein [Pseudonocardia lacus]|uniref:hypothetical protein n=1 Tax=Pseudonocardia lacus TaxID=2835865 RepID=UPI001BDCEB42|nr:hypothetical protein [Pseudonocardia lacus]